MRTVTRTPWVAPPWRRNPERPSRLFGRCEKKTFQRPGLAAPKNGHGTIAYDQRLWQHSSTQKGISGSLYQGCFAYGLKDEWALIQRAAEYIEFQDRTTRPWTIYRISKWLAQQVGHAEETPNGPRWLVPLEYYLVVDRA